MTKPLPHLYYGDNLTIMRGMSDESVDLIYLDPPFSSQRNYNLLYKSATGVTVPEQVEAFCDTWEMDAEKEDLIVRMPVMLKYYGMSEDMVRFWDSWFESLRATNSKLLAYLVYMSYRLLEMRRILKPTGSIYLHCDPTASHYIKIVMDAIFGYKNFRNEIVWCYTGPGSPGMRQFNRKHDILFWYTMGKTWTFNRDSVRIPHNKLNTNRAGAMIKSALTSEERDTYLKMGKVPETWWPDFSPVGRLAKERLGYPTQKPIALLERIIRASSREGDVVFDPFCGCGTTVYAAHLNKRQWIGCDIAILAVRLVRDILKKRYALIEGQHYHISGIPLSIDAARDLFKRDTYQFQYWAVELAGGFCSQRRSGDRGIDGRIYFETHDGIRRHLKSMVLSVKGGKLEPKYVRELRGVLEREAHTPMGGFICLQAPTIGMMEEAVKAGGYEYQGKSYACLQIRTIEELLTGKGFDTPSQVQTLNWEKQGSFPF